jgi:isopentenyl-diphosphate delta-isomerase
MSDRKNDHIELAFKSQTSLTEKDNRFIYEPLLSAHPSGLMPFSFLNKTLQTPIWASSMTGGTKLAKKINENIARVCHDFGMGMGLGSCRTILDDDTHFDDFNVRQFIGDNLPLYANLGIAQVDILLQSKNSGQIKNLIDKLCADGLIVHVNPLQEYFQPEGNELKRAPIDVIEDLLQLFNFPVIIKEVGQGMGFESLRKLLQMPVKAIEFGAFGGTNFSALELLRSHNSILEVYKPFAFIGQTAEEMVDSVNKLVQEFKISGKEIIISGGIKTYLDGYFLMNKCSLPSVYGHASTILKYAKDGYEALHNYIDSQVKGLALANAYLKINPEAL